MEQIRGLMDNPENKRLVSVLALAHHGKSVLTDCLIAKGGINIPENPWDGRYTSPRYDRDEQRPSLKPTSVLLYHEHSEKDALEQSLDPCYLITLVYSPRHPDFMSESTILRAIDGALVLVDSVEGVSFQTEALFRQVLLERIKPVLIINKVDCLLDLQVDAEDMYQNFFHTIEKVNIVISAYDSGAQGDLQIDPSKANCAFASGKMGWAFTLQHFARIYASKFGVVKSKIITRLWGENYFDSKSRKWQKSGVTDSGETLRRAFCTMVIEPMKNIATACVEGNYETLNKMLRALGIELSPAEKELQGRKLLKEIMSKWLNAADCLLEIMVVHLPSPKSAGVYRTEILYEGRMDDPCRIAMQNCDPFGPLMLYVSSMMHYTGSRFIALGRVFSGTVAKGQKVRIMGADYKSGYQSDLAIKCIQRTVLVVGHFVEMISDVPAGNIVGLIGVDQYLIKTGTISNHEEACKIKTVKYSVSPVMRVTVMPKNGAADMPKLVDGLKKLVKTDPVAKFTVCDSGDYIIECTGELHVEICLNSLEREFARIELSKSAPVVIYKETVTAQSEQVCMSKSPNKQNRLYCVAMPLMEGLCEDIENGKITPAMDHQSLINILAGTYSWEVNEVARLWGFGPESKGPNLLVDFTSGVQNLHEIRASMESAFQWTACEGVLCGESMRGVQINVVDVTLHSDAIHRGGGQIIPTSRRVYYACELAAKPALQEPVFLWEIQVLSDYIAGMYECLNSRRGIFISEELVGRTPMIMVKALVPVAESLGLEKLLQNVTLGQVFSQCLFHHWQNVSGNPLDLFSKAGEIVQEIRKNKGMRIAIPLLEEYSDQL